MPEPSYLTVLTGIGGLVSILVSSLLVLQNYFHPSQDTRRIKIHCYIGLTAFLLALIHALTANRYSPNISGMISLGLLFIGNTMGVVMRFLPEAGGIRFHARSYHPAVVLGLVITGAIHVSSWLF
jgi:hypothetical protein